MISPTSCQCLAFGYHYHHPTRSVRLRWNTSAHYSRAIPVGPAAPFAESTFPEFIALALSVRAASHMLRTRAAPDEALPGLRFEGSNSTMQ